MVNTKLKSILVTILFLFNFHNPDMVQALTVPLTTHYQSDIAEANALVVKGQWQGNDVSVFVDTGATTGGISAQLAAKLSPIAGRKIHTAGASGTVRESELYQVKGLEIGGKILEPFEAYVHPETMGETVDISVGLPQLMKYVVEIDLIQKKFSLFNNNPYSDVEMNNLRLQPETAGGCLLISAKIGNFAATQMILDTGAGINCIEPRRLNRFRYIRAGKVESIDGAGIVETEPTIKVKQVCVTGICNKDEIFLVTHLRTPGEQTTVDGIIGMPFWRNKRLLIDLPNMKFKIFEQ